MKKNDPPSTGSVAQSGALAKQSADSHAPDCVRREHDRFVVELQVNVLSEHNLYAGLAENISAGGLFIATHQLQKVGSKIELSLRMPDSEEAFQIVGEVRWVRLYNEQSDTPPGFGVRFIELPAGAAAAIGRFLNQREPLFFDDE
ncbi:MAG TPA: TIGR02266 family protein [Polyangiaceae bacterium]